MSVIKSGDLAPIPQNAPCDCICTGCYTGQHCDTATCANSWDETFSIRDDVAWLSAWNDRHGVDPHIRMLKISEEYGEATDAYLGYLGANPRKGVTNDIDKVWLELADTALAALVAIESLGGDPESELLQRIAFVKARLESHDAG